MNLTLSAWLWYLPPAVTLILFPAASPTESRLVSKKPVDLQLPDRRGGISPNRRVPSSRGSSTKDLTLSP